MYTIIFTKSSEKQYQKVDKKYKSSLIKAISRIAENPFCGKLLSGEFKGLYRVRFSRYRIVYKVEKNRLIVVIVSVKHRSEVYK